MAVCFYPLPDNFLTDFFFKSKYCYYLEALKENYFPEILVKIHGCVEEKNIYIYICPGGRPLSKLLQDSQ